jgi:pullulanase
MAQVQLSLAGRAVVAAGFLLSGAASAHAQPSSVTIPGSLQSEVGCPGDWQPECALTHLGYDADDDVWQGSFALPAGSFEYKAALNDSWDENYGANAARNGPNIPLNLSAPASVKFYYSHQTHWVTSNRNAVIATAAGSFQSELGCPGDWQPDCLRSWLQDPDGDGVYTFVTTALPPGDYEVKAALNESWDENYGEGGVRNGANIPFTVTATGKEIAFLYDAATHVLTVSAEGAPRGSLRRARAQWLSADTVAWGLASANAGGTAMLHYAPDGGLVLGAGGVSGGTTIPLTYDPAGLSPAQRALFPQLAGYAAFKLPPGRLPEVPAALRGQLAVSAADATGTPVDATSVQIPGVLDDLYTYQGPLGATFTAGAPTLRVWAPTARAVKLQLFADSTAAAPEAVIDMVRTAPGVWAAAGTPAWSGKYYLYEVEVYVRSTGRVEHNLVTDPYSVSLARNSRRSQILDLETASTKPAGWNGLRKPALSAPEDITLYELHVRDFSATDESVPAALRGTYRAFTVDSNGTRHLATLALAGLTHVHLLPTFDITSVNEDKSQWKAPGDLSLYPPDSEQQQAAVGAVRDEDAFNWGYDPWHYTVPEGSYAVQPDGAGRVVEFRQMVQGLSRLGLRVVMDVVYNHTSAAGQSDRAVLDRIVPGYYHRLNADGEIEHSTCCENTASEHAMMEKLLVDSVVTWAKQYKVDGFRFDIMGHHMKRNLLKLRAALDALTPARDGVDGPKVYLYGEGWNFGEVANNARGENAIQRNMAGTGIGTFNDRFRDGARGGGPFSGIQEQGFLTGLFVDPNTATSGSPAEQRERLLQHMDWLRVGVAGNLADYAFQDRFGNTVRGRDVDYNGQPAGYTADPQEVINYVEAHDDATLFDTIQLKAAPATTLADRVREQCLGMSLLGFSQGVPFFHAGTELLRSKSLDRNSYNSGDWFNRLDYSARSSNWGVGLPPAQDNQANWPVMRPLLADLSLRPTAADIRSARAHFLEILAIRRSSPLFRLRTGAEVQERLRFYNTGPGQVPGVLAFGLSDATGSVDHFFSRVVVLLNADPASRSIVVPDLAGARLHLHPFHLLSADARVRTSTFDRASGSFNVPGRTAVVFVAYRAEGR